MVAHKLAKMERPFPIQPRDFCFLVVQAVAEAQDLQVEILQHHQHKKQF
jgi:hypothetical protein